MPFIFQTLFVAHGPAFKKETEVEHFQNTELYNMMAGNVTISLAVYVPLSITVVLISISLKTHNTRLQQQQLVQLSYQWDEEKTVD